MATFLFLRFLWNTFLFLGGAFVLYVLVTYPFQKRWLRAKLRTDEWLQGNFFRGDQISAPGFAPVGTAITGLAQSLDKMIQNDRNVGRDPDIKNLRAEAKELVMSICESISGLLEHWKSLNGLDLVEQELAERSLRDTRNLETLHENLESFRASLQRAAVSKSSEGLNEASERVIEISHFTRLMSESLESTE